MTSRPRIGVAACFMHADPQRPVFKGKTLLYLENSLAHWLMDGGAVAYLLPQPSASVTAAELLEPLDGLVLQGGSDVSPDSYGEPPIRPEWKGDEVRDRYESGLLRTALDQGLPVLGVCRGMQMINVALGGSLFQDIATQCPGAQVHRDWKRYDTVHHDVVFEDGSLLGSLYPGASGGRVNTIHHQAVKDLGDGLKVEARSSPDGIIEAVRHEGPSFMYAVQWHPEFQDPSDRSLLDPAPIRDLFLSAVRRRRGC